MQILDQFGNPYGLTQKRIDRIENSNSVRALRHQITRELRGRYDGAQTSTDNENHWANADSLNSLSRNSRGPRATLRKRARYEVIENNPYLHGAMLSIARDFVGKGGPKLQIIDRRLSPQERLAIERASLKYRKKTKYKKKLFQGKVGKIVEGEVFYVEFSNQRLRRQGLPLEVDSFVMGPDFIGEDLFGFEGSGFNSNIIDGIRYDKNLIPEAYYVKERSPQAVNSIDGFLLRGNWVSDDFVSHWYRELQGGWLRGIPEITPSLSLCALLRRYTLAVVQNAELGANLTGVLETEMPPNTTAWGDTTDPEDAFFTFPVERGMLMALPGGQKLHSFDPGQPLAVYDKFVDAVLREIIRPLCIPFNLAVGFSGGYNMASGTLDRQMYIGGIDHERSEAEDEVLEPLDERWWYEAIRSPNYLVDDQGNDLRPGIIAKIGTMFPDHTNRWDEVPEHTDPAKVANSLQTMWEMGQITDRDIQEKRFNRSVDEHYENLKKQQETRESIGLSTPGGNSQQQQPAEVPEDPEEAAAEDAEEE